MDNTGRKKTSSRALKSRLKKQLARQDFEHVLDEIPERQAVNPLISLLCSGDELTKWRAVFALGKITGRLAASDMDSARVVMRRLMWHLNDESGGIGWGVPEAMGQIMACHEGLALEYSKILLSYIMDGPNYLEHTILRRGAVWGVGRLARVRAELLKDAKGPLTNSLGSEDAHIRGFAAYALGALGDKGAKPDLEKIVADEARIALFEDGQLKQTTVGAITLTAIKALS